MSLTFGYKTDVGRKRQNNQDSYVIVRGETLNGELDALFVIADGMGGRQGGEVASEIVVRALPEVVTSHLQQRNGDKSPVDAARLLEEGIALAHRRVRQRQAEQLELNGMGTTCVAAILDANILTVANVGDSRAYLLRGGQLTQITEDHSEVWQEVLAGRMTREEAQHSRFRNVITRAVGAVGSAIPDIDTVELKEGDSVLLCSDGLSSELEDDEIARLLAGEADPQSACEDLVEAALRNGGKDNVTVIALRYGAFIPRSLPEKEKPTGETGGDPLDAWRDSMPRAAAAYGTDITGPEGLADGRNQPMRRRGNSPILLTLLFLLAILAGGEGYALYRLYPAYQALKNVPSPVIPPPPVKPTDHALSYREPVVVTSKIVRETPLAVDDEGSILAVSKDGSLMRVDRQGQVTPLPDQPRITEKPVSAVAASPLLLAVDASGNRYQINPGEPAIAKYDAEGSLLSASLVKSKLTRPTALTVDAAGTLYVIDEHHLKKIAAFDTPKSPPAISPQSK